jgi:sugar phosphate isomerase/epimerase
MLLGVITDEISQDLDTALDMAVDCGFDGVEIRSVFDKPPAELTIKDCEWIGLDIRSAGLEAVVFDGPVWKRDFPRSRRERSEARSELESAVEQTHALGARYLRVFSFLRQTEPSPVAAAALMSSLLEEAGSIKVALLLETGTRTNSPSGPYTATLMRHLQGIPLQVLWDPGNSVFSGIERLPFPRSYELLRDAIAHIHVKDPVGSSHYTRLGVGDFPWSELVRALAADEYKGYLSLETHWRPGRPLTPDLRDMPWCSEFSAGGLDASRTCMETLKAMADDAESSN